MVASSIAQAVAVEVRVSPQAVEQAKQAQQWWQTNRGAAPSLLHDELAKGLQRLAELPESGPPYTPRGVDSGLRMPSR